MTTALEQAQELSNKLGVNVSVIDNPEWDSLMQSGVTCKLHIGRWRAERARSLSDMGVTLDTKEEEAAWSSHADSSDLGTMKLLPVAMVKAMASKDSAARAGLRAAGITTRWGTFLPVARVPDWLETDKRREADYLQYRTIIADDYENIKKNAYSAYLDAAIEQFRRLNKNPDAYVSWEYRSQYADRIMSSFASRDEMVESIYWRREFGFLPMPSMIAQEQAARNDIIAKSNLTQQQRQLMDTMNADVMRSASAAKRELYTGFLNDVRKEIAARIAEATQDILNAMRKNNRMPGRSYLQIKNLIETVDQLNILDDEAVKNAMAELKARTSSLGADDVNFSDMVRTLKKINMEARTQLDSITNDVRSPRLALATETPIEEFQTAGRRPGRI